CILSRQSISRLRRSFRRHERQSNEHCSSTPMSPRRTRSSVGCCSSITGIGRRQSASSDEPLRSIRISLRRVWITPFCSSHPVARSMLQQLQAADEKRFVCFYTVGLIYHVLGEDEKALAALERGYQTRTG